MPILSVRNGFFYQDLCAVELFLKEYLNRQLASIFVDYEYDEGTQKSFDIYIRKSDRTELCYEIKTGDGFKTQNTLINEAFEGIIAAIKLGHITPNSTSYLIISPDFRRQIADYYNKILRVQGNSLSDPQTALAVGEFAACIDSQYYTDHSDLQRMLRLINIQSGQSNARARGTQLCPIENDIVGMIKDLARNIGINSPNSGVFQEETLLRELVYTVHSKAGTKEDLLPEFRRLIIDFFARYDLRTQGVDTGRGGALDNSTRSIQAKIEEFERNESTPEALNSNEAQGARDE